MDFEVIRRKAMESGVTPELLKMTYDYYMTRDARYPEPINYASTMSHYIEEFKFDKERAREIIKEFQAHRVMTQ